MMYKVFIVDDEPAIAKGLEKLIDWNRLECQTFSFTDSRASYEAALIENPHIIITDIKMPFMDGLEFIKKLNSEGINCDVIILSGYSEFEYARKAIDLGVNTYLLKPVEEVDLESIVVKTIDQLKKEEAKKKELNRLISFYETGALKMRDIILQDIVNSEDYSIDEIIDITEGLEPGFTDSPVICAILETRTESDDNILLTDSISNIVREVFHSIRMKFMLFQYTGSQYGIILNNVPLNSNEYFRNSFLKVGRKLLSSIGIKSFIGVGEVRASISDLNNSFQQALTALDYKIIRHDNEVIMYCDINFSTSGINIPVKIFHLLADSVENNDINGVKMAIDKSFDILLGNTAIKPQELKTHCLNLLLACTKNLSYVQLQLYKALGKDMLSLDKLSRFDSPEKLKNWMINLVRSIIELKNQEEVVSTKGDLVEDIKKYIDENYNENLTLPMISEHFFLNQSYISQLFKKRTGHTYIAYLTNKRMEKARELLTNTDLKVYEVCYSVGYGDVKHFSKTFEKIIGVKPSNYKKSIAGRQKTNGA